MVHLDINRFVSENTLIVGHDAGSSNLLINNVDRGRLNECTIVCEGPAKQALQALTKVRCRDHLQTSINQATQLLLLTGWQSDLIGIALSAGRKKSLKTIGLVDRAINLEYRFTFSGNVLIPDVILAPEREKIRLPDSLAMTAIEYFKDNSFDELTREISLLRRDIDEFKYDYLIIGQPIVYENGEVNHLPQYQEVAKLRRAIGGGKRIGFRPHPSETTFRKELLPNDITICDLGEMASIQIANAQTVVGFNSVLLDAAEAANVPCIRLLFEEQKIDA